MGYDDGSGFDDSASSYDQGTGDTYDATAADYGDASAGADAGGGGGQPVHATFTYGGGATDGAAQVTITDGQTGAYVWAGQLSMGQSTPTLSFANNGSGSGSATVSIPPLAAGSKDFFDGASLYIPF